MAIQCVVVSARPEDIEFCRKIAKRGALDFHVFASAKEVDDFLAGNNESIVFWDVDHRHAETPGHAVNHRAVSTALARHIPAERIFALSDSAINELEHLKTGTPFGHYFIRHYADPAAEIASRVIQAAIVKDPFELSFYMPEETPVQKIVIKESAQKRAATEALHNIFLKRGLPSRLATLAAQAADELMINAIFDAPRTTEKVGKKASYQIAHRSSLERSENFVLQPREAVSLEIASAPTYIAICVSDLFGSIRKEEILPFLKKDYSETGYNPKGGAAGALGINGIISSGLSLLYLWRPGERTEAILFIPVLDTFKAFRTSFRFFSFLSK